MRTYRISIEETVVGSFEVEAFDADEAVDKAIQRYKKVEFVLEPGEVIARQIAVVDLENEINWIEF